MSAAEAITMNNFDGLSTTSLCKTVMFSKLQIKPIKQVIGKKIFSIIAKTIDSVSVPFSELK